MQLSIELYSAWTKMFFNYSVNHKLFWIRLVVIELRYSLTYVTNSWPFLADSDNIDTPNSDPYPKSGTFAIYIIKPTKPEW